MADNIPITPGSGANVATDERSIGGSTVQVQRVDEQGSTAILSGRATIGTAEATAVAARDTRKRVILLALETNTADIDVGDAVVAGSDFPLAPGASVTLHTTAAIKAISTAAGQILAFIEEYDT